MYILTVITLSFSFSLSKYFNNIKQKRNLITADHFLYNIYKVGDDDEMKRKSGKTKYKNFFYFSFRPIAIK